MEKKVVASFLLYLVISFVFFFFLIDFPSYLAMPQRRLIVYCLVTELIQLQLECENMGFEGKKHGTWRKIPRE